MLRFCSLGSGSSGNSTLVESINGATKTRVLVDCGFPYKHLEQRLAIRGLTFADIDAIFVTHEHSDHVGCARQLAQTHDLALWMSRGTFDAIGSPELGPNLRMAKDGEAFVVQDLDLMPFTVPHDAKEPLQIRIASGVKSIAILTDLGHATPYLLNHLKNTDALVLEWNHDSQLLADSTYPPFLKQRISGAYGHLSNAQAMEIIAAVNHSNLQHVVAAHLSEQNNNAQWVSNMLCETLKRRTDEIAIADANDGTVWLTID